MLRVKQIIQPIGIGPVTWIEVAGGGIHEKENRGREAERQANIGQRSNVVPQKVVEPGGDQMDTESGGGVKKLLA